MKILITGISGFIGTKLALALLKQGHEVSGIGFRRSIDHLRECWGEHYDDINYAEVDICDAVAIRQHIFRKRSAFIYHLAAQANIPHARANPISTYNTNILGTQNVLSAAASSDVMSVHLASSSDVYGPVAEADQPITEDQPLQGGNPYAISKIAMEGIGRSFYHEGVNVIVTRLFTTTGPGQCTDAAVSYFAYQIARIRLGLQEPIFKCGNIDNYRTLLDVDDVVRAFLTLPNLPVGKSFEDSVFNVTGNEEVSLRSLIENLMHITEVDAKIEQQGVRISDITRQLGDGSKFKKASGWELHHAPMSAACKVYQYWLGKLGG